MNKSRNKYWQFYIYLALALAAITVFWQLHYHEFISFDDDVYIVDNSYVKDGLTRQGLVWAFTKIHAYNWHPLTWISHMLDCEIYGLNAGGHHFTNVLLHTANCILLLLVFNRMSGNFWASAFVAAAFALHPLHVESVAWASERKDVLSTFFWVLTMWAYIRYVEGPNVKRYLLALLLFVLGLLAKQMLVTLPFVLLLLDYWPLSRFSLECQSQDKTTKEANLITIRRCILEKAPFLVFSVAASFLVYNVQRTTGVMRLLIECPLAYRVGNAFVSYIVYILKMLWPFRLAIFYPHPSNSLEIWKVVVSVLLLTVITAAAVWKGRRHRYFVVGWLWYLGTLVPVIGLVQVGDQALADRYSYITITGLFIIIAWGVPEILAKVRYRKAILSICACLLLLVLCVITWFQVRYWRNNATLYRHATEVIRNNWWAHNNFGIALSKKGKLDEALSQFNKAIEAKADYHKAHNNLGNALELLGRPQEAIAHYLQALQANPYYAKAHGNLAILLAKRGQLDEALTYFLNAIELDALDPTFQNGAARILATHPDPSKRDVKQAISLAERAAELSNYNDPIILNTLAASYAAAGQYGRAVTTSEAALGLAKAVQNYGLVEHIQSQLELYRQEVSGSEP